MSSEKINNTILLLLLLSSWLSLSSSYAFHGRNNQTIIHIFLLLNVSDWGAYRLNGVRIFGLNAFFQLFFTLYALARYRGAHLNVLIVSSINILLQIQRSIDSDIPEYFATDNPNTTSHNKTQSNLIGVTTLDGIHFDQRNWLETDLISYRPHKHH